MYLTEKEKKLLLHFKTQSAHKRNELLINILKMIAAGGVMAALLVAPNMGLLFKYWKIYKKEEQRKIRRRVYYLIKKGYIKYDADKNKYFLTSKGSIYLHKNEIKELKPKKKAWDKKWRLIFFDIPESKKSARVMLRSKIIEWGFVGIQKSIFLSKLDCKAELEKLKEYFDLSDELILLELNDKQVNEDLKNAYKKNKDLHR